MLFGRLLCSLVSIDRPAIDFISSRRAQAVSQSDYSVRSSRFICRVEQLDIIAQRDFREKQFDILQQRIIHVGIFATGGEKPDTWKKAEAAELGENSEAKRSRRRSAENVDTRRTRGLSNRDE